MVTYSVSKTGYDVKTGTISEVDEDKTVNVSLDADVTLTFAVTPNDASISITCDDDEAVITATSVSADVGSEVEYTITATGYQTFTSSATLSSTETATISLLPTGYRAAWTNGGDTIYTDGLSPRAGGNVYTSPYSAAPEEIDSVTIDTSTGLTTAVQYDATVYDRDPSHDASTTPPQPTTPDLDVYINNTLSKYGQFGNIHETDEGEDYEVYSIVPDDGTATTVPALNYIDISYDSSALNNAHFFGIGFAENNGDIVITINGVTHTFQSCNNMFIIKTVEYGNAYYWFGGVESVEDPVSGEKSVNTVYQITPPSDLVTLFNGGSLSTLQTLTQQQVGGFTSYEYFYLFDSLQQAQP